MKRIVFLNFSGGRSFWASLAAWASDPTCGRPPRLLRWEVRVHLPPGEQDQQPLGRHSSTLTWH